LAYVPHIQVAGHDLDSSNDSSNGVFLRPSRPPRPWCERPRRSGSIDARNERI